MSVGFGQSSSGSFAWYDRDSCSWKTHQASFLLTKDQPWEKSLETWPQAGLIVNGTAFQVAPSVRHILDTGSSLLPTLRANSKENRTKKETPSQKAGKHGRYLAVEIRKYPTLTANQYRHPDLDALLMRREKCKQTARNGNGFGLTLNQTLELEAKGYLPTLTSRDWRSGKNKNCWSNSRPLNEVLFANEDPKSRSGDSDGGLLNPAWCEWYQGFPITWTELKP
jgi:hypothetical protein